ncbi:MAG: hypothetical protein V7751_22460, partial [Pseudoalteromonas distincta]
MKFIRTRTCFSLTVLTSVGLMFYIYGRYPGWEDEVPLFLGLANAAANISAVAGAECNTVIELTQEH